MNKSILIILCMMTMFAVGCGSKTTENLSGEEQTKQESFRETSGETTANGELTKSELVLVEGKITQGKEAWSNFLLKTGMGTKGEITIKDYYTDDGEEQIIERVLRYDGEYYFLTYEGEKEPHGKYRYVIERSGRMPNAAISDHVCYLVNDQSLTYEQLQWSEYSSNSNDWIDGEPVYWEALD